MNKAEYLEFGMSCIRVGAGDAVLGEDAEAWEQQQFSTAADQMVEHPEDFRAWRDRIRVKLEKLGEWAWLVAAIRSEGAKPLQVLADDLAVAFDLMDRRGLLTSLCDPQR